MLSALLAVTAAALQTVRPRLGMVITQSCKIAPGDYSLPVPQGAGHAGGHVIPTFSPAITIRGSHIRVDFRGVVIRGSAETTDPDMRKGLGILVEGNDVTVIGVTARGYKVALMANHCDGLKLVDCDFSYNWKARLYSTPQREDLRDWQSYHHNELGQWLRYGAGAYLVGCDHFEVRGCRATGGQCGLMLTDCNHGLVWNCDFSFLSGLGIGMYRSSDNRIMHNRIDWDVRGYSYGVYNRGQDSAGILIYEQSMRNVFAYNSVTHGGDGFFLWAGQSTLDTGSGGCNDNLVVSNDFSHSPCNGIEATFSRNRFSNNLLMECWHGVWGGYSYDTEIDHNTFKLNASSIAIEHGQRNSVRDNVFDRENSGIDLWADPPDPSFAYAKHRDVKSHSTIIADNRFESIPGFGVRLRNSSDDTIARNDFGDVLTPIETVSNVPGLKEISNSIVAGIAPTPTMDPGGKVLQTVGDFKIYEAQFKNDWKPFSAQAKALVAPLKGGMDPFLKPGTLRGQRAIVIDQWGPYDFRRPIVVPRGEAVVGDGARRIHFDVFGPKGVWRLKSATKGVTLSSASGIVPGSITATFAGRSAGEAGFGLIYKGGRTVDERGIATPAGRLIPFGYSKFNVPINWDVKFFSWGPTTDPRTHLNAFEKLLAGLPMKEVHEPKIDFAGPPFLPGLPSNYFATVADADVTLPDGVYELDLTTDDGARLWVDGKVVIGDAWKYQGPTTYSAKSRLRGTHHIHIEHFQIDGWSQLQFDIRPVRP